MRLGRLLIHLSIDPKQQPKADKKAKTAQPKYTVEQMKEKLKKLSPELLEKAFEDARARGTPERVPVTIQALAALHKEAEYVRNGRPHSATIYVDPYRSASAFVKLRPQAVNMPKVVRFADPKASNKQLEQPKAAKKAEAALHPDSFDFDFVEAQRKKVPPAQLEHLKDQLKKMPLAQLKKVHKKAEARGTPTRLPATILALDALHRSAQYVRDGKPHDVAIYADPYRGAAAFVNLRYQAVNMPKVVHFAGSESESE